MPGCNTLAFRKGNYISNIEKTNIDRSAEVSIILFHRFHRSSSLRKYLKPQKLDLIPSRVDIFNEKKKQ